MRIVWTPMTLGRLMTKRRRSRTPRWRKSSKRSSGAKETLISRLDASDNGKKSDKNTEDKVKKKDKEEKVEEGEEEEEEEEEEVESGEEDRNGRALYEVAHILEKRVVISSGVAVTEYLIEWEDRDDGTKYENTWEMYDDIKGCEVRLQEFRERELERKNKTQKKRQLQTTVKKKKTKKQMRDKPNAKTKETKDKKKEADSKNRNEKELQKPNECNDENQGGTDTECHAKKKKKTTATFWQQREIDERNTALNYPGRGSRRRSVGAAAGR